MKKLVFIVLLSFCSLLVEAQVFIEGGLGYDISTTKAIGSLNFGYTVGHAVITGIIQPTLIRSNNSHNYFGGELSYAIKERVFPAIGYYYNMVSTDDKQLNYSSIGASLKILFPIIQRRGLFLKGFYINNQYQVVGGIYANL